MWFKNLTLKSLDALLSRDTIIIGAGRNAKRYFKNYIGFDIETTTVINDGQYRAYMYIWTMTINNEVIRGTSWQEFLELMDLIKAILAPPSDHFRTLIFIANLSFEFQFIRKHLNITDSFFLEEREPLYIIHDDFIEFRDALQITGGNLEYLARSYCTTQKAVGDLDYSIIRNHTDALHMTDKEYNYVDNDTKILSEYSEYYFQHFGYELRFFPLTQTGILRRITKDACKKYCKVKHQNISNIMLALFPSEKLYKLMMRWLFRGGYVHGAISTTGELLIWLVSLDRTSSYPASLNFEYYPVTRFKLFEADLFEEYCSTKCVMAYVEFTGIEKTLIHSIESRSKIIEHVNGVFDNGRLCSADKIRVFITEVDYSIYKMFYKWKEIRVLKCWCAERGKLPKYMLEPINENYTIKSKLKMEGLSDTVDYVNAKVNVNAGYGNAVTRMKENQITYDSSTDDYVINNQFDYESEVKKQVLLPQWGIWCTAHSRYALLSLFYKIDRHAQELGRLNDVHYGDTDSIKLTNYRDHKYIIDEYNAKMAQNVKDMCQRFGYDEKYFKGLGSFDFEYVIRKFKHQGAKRYITNYYDKKSKHYKTKITIAGLPKDSLLNYSRHIHRSPFDLFEDEMNIPSEFTKKLRAVYIDEPHSDIVNGELMEELSSVALAPVDFTLNIDDDYIEAIADEVERRLERRYY